MQVGILGLGLIGGSMARCYSKAGHRVLACEKDGAMLSFALLSGIVQGELTKEELSRCDLVLLAIYPEASADWLAENAPLISPHALVLDLCGTKEKICRRCFPLASRYGFTFVGGHPMAGTHNSGLKYSRSNMFQGAPMVLVPPRFDDIALLQRVKDALAPCGFGSYSVTTGQEHDKMIAFTSQMPHVLSNAFIKSPTARQHKGFSAGSYKDLTRVAWLNPQMWAQLCMENRENMMAELDIYLANLEKYRLALENRDENTLIALLEEGKKCKEAVDG